MKLVLSALFALMLPAYAVASADAHYSVSGFYWRVVAFVLFVGLLYKFVGKRLSDETANGVASASDAMKKAELACKDSEAQLVDYVAKINAMSEELKKMKEVASATAQREAQDLIASAERMAEKLKRSAENTLNVETEQARLAIRAVVAKSALAKAEEQVVAMTLSDKQKYIADNLMYIGEGGIVYD
ncbi:hypothetical protein RsTz2092_05420 [Deferribacterales bacterium RsTz2092]|nr:hypothetical protein AGMMS49941_00550 [Deferribacterales bacterium]